MNDKNKSIEELINRIEELEQENATYKSLFYNSPDHILIMDKKGIIISVNKQLIKDTGYPEKDFIGKHFSKLPLIKKRVKDIPKYIKLYNSAIKGIIPTPFIVPWLHKDTTLHQSEAYVNIIEKESKPFIFILAFRDITEQLKRDQLIKKSEERLNAILENSISVFAIVDKIGKVLYESPSLEKVYGWKTEEIVGRNIMKLVHPKDYAYSFKNFMKLIANPNVPHTIETRYKHKDGSWRDIEVTGINLLHNPIIKGIVLTSHDITERKKTVNKQVESEKRFRELSELLPLIIFEMDLKGDFTYLNNNGYKYFGYTEKDYKKGLNAINMVAPQDREKADRNIMERLKGLKFKPVEYIMQRKNGSMFPAIINSSPIFVDKNPVGLRGYVFDISEQKYQEELLKEKAEREKRVAIEALLNAPVDSVLLLNAKGIIIDVNETFCSLVNMEHKQLIGENVFKVIPFKSNAVKKAVFDDVIRSKKTVRLEDENPHTGMVTDNVIYPILNNDGSLKWIAMISRDITARKKAERVLKENENLFKAIIENSEPVIFMIDKKGIFTMSEGKALKSLNLKPGQMVGMSAYEAYRNYPTIIRGIKQALKGNTYKDTVAVNVGDKMVHFDFFHSPLRDVNNQIIGLLGMAVDITELKNMQQQLIHSEKMSAIGQLASGITHEFNNLLAIMMGNTEYALQNVEDMNIRHSLESIEKAIDRGENLIQDLRIFSRPRELNLNTDDIAKVIKEVYHIQHRQLTLNKIKVVMRFFKHSPVSFDWGQMEQVFSNLFLNSQHAMRQKRKGTITITVKNVGKSVQINFTDTGAGMNEDIQKRIFEPFFTTKSVHSKKSLQIKGTGLGLSVTSTIITQHKGAIKVQSKEGKGTTFSITLPAVKSLKQKKNKDENVQVDIQQIIERIKNTEILIVDDEKAITDSLKLLFNLKGFNRVICRNSGKKALQKLKSSSPDIIFLDLQMSPMSGEEFLALIKNMKVKIPVVLISGKFDINKKEMKRKGVVGFVKKPFKINKIVEIMDRIL